MDRRRFLKYAMVLVIVLSGAMCAECQGSPDQVEPTSAGTKPDVTYAIMIDSSSAAEHRAHVRIALRRAESLSLTLTMHAYHGSYPIPILNFTASEIGTVLPSREYYTDKDRFWTVQTRGPTRVTIDYDVIFGTIRGNYDQHLGFLGNDFGMSMAEWVFLIPYNISPSSIRVDFRLPTDWKVFAPWKRDGDTFYPMSLEYLATSTFALGHFEAYSKTIGTTNVSIAVYSKWAATTQKKLAETAFRIFDYQTNLFGKSVGEQYLGVFSPVADDGKPIWGGEYSQSQGVSIRELNNFTPAMMQFSHQIFHRWNSWEPYGMRMSGDEEQWFSEGANVYYESKTLIDLGLMKEHYELRALYSEYLANYLNTSKDMPVAMAGKYHRPEQDSPAEFIMYRKGALTCLLLDINILRTTNGERDLGLLLRKMYELYGQRKGSYSNEGILRNLAKMADYPFTDFFKRYVYGTEGLPLDGLFTKMNLPKTSNDWEVGDEWDLRATLADFNSRPIAGETVIFYVNSTPIATVMTDSQGLAITTLIVNSTGTLEVEAFYPGAKDYTHLQSSDSFTITVEHVGSTTTKISTIVPDQAFLLAGFVLIVTILALGPALRALKRKQNS